MSRDAILHSIAALALLAGQLHSQSPEPGAGVQSQIPAPVKVIVFRAVEQSPDYPLPPVMIGHPNCGADGALVLDALDVDTLNRTAKTGHPVVGQTAIVIRGQKVQSITSTGIQDLHDVSVRDVFSADSGLYFLVSASKEQPGEHGRGKSSAGISWSSYRNYIARFDADGAYKGATEIQTECDMLQPGHCEVSHLAVFPSGDLLVTQSDPSNSRLRLLYLKSSGEVVKPVDIPAGRKPIDWGSPDSNPAVRQEASTFLGSVFFTAYDQSILVWRTNSSDPILEIRSGGAVREVPIQVPNGERFVDMISSNDRWVAHFRNEDTRPDAPMSKESDTYYEVRPQDGSLAAQLVQKGDDLLSIACESSGTYTSFKMSQTGNLVLLRSE